MSISLADVKKMNFIDSVIVHSLNFALYQVSIVIDGEEHYVLDKQGLLLKSHHKLALQAVFEKLNVGSMRLRHQSAYDEMIGQPIRENANTLDVPLGNVAMGSLDGLSEQ